MAAWASTFDRLELDLQQALELERSLAPARPPGQQQQIADTTGRFWAAVDRALALAGRGDEAAAHRGASAPTRCRATPSW